MSCTPPASAEGSPRLSLPVVPARPTVVRPSRMGKWRALSLIAIHVAFLVHVLHWKATGRTLSPVEPSESMESLATGRVNAGALFFAAALASTLLFGRFLCGWGCHMVAVQDLCGWLMRRAGFRPKPFRSRLLVFVPLGAAIYMFIWPTAYRLWVGAPPPPVTTHLFKSQFWATFPGPVVAVLTLLICGGAIVYFLGNKGFCTYACPYGGFFGLLDRAAPLRVRVTDACNRCGHCSAACSSNVRVAEEVHLFKMVVDPGCMKCLDCVSVCPNDALYVGLGRPALAAPRAAQPRKPLRHDGGWGTELALLAIFGVSLLVWRGLYGQVPFLFSLGLSSITAYLLLRLWHLASRADVTFHRLALRRRGTIRPAGWAYVVAALLLLAFLAHCGWVQFNQARGDAAFSPGAGAAPGVTPVVAGWQFAPSLDPLIDPAERPAIAAAERAYGRVQRAALIRIPAVESALAWLDLLAGRSESAEARLRALLKSRMSDAERSSTWANLSKVCAHRRLWVHAAHAAEQAVALDPRSSEAYFTRGLLQLFQRNAAGAVSSFESARQVAAALAAESPGGGELDPLIDAFHAEALRQVSRLDEAAELERRMTHPAAALHDAVRAARLFPKSAAMHRAAAVALAALGDWSAARSWIDQAVALAPDDYCARLWSARARLELSERDAALQELGVAEKLCPTCWTAQRDTARALILARQPAAALARARRAVQLQPNAADAHAMLGAVLLAAHDLPGATAAFADAVRLEPVNREYRLRYGFLLVSAGRGREAHDALDALSREAGPLADRAREILQSLDAPR